MKSIFQTALKLAAVAGFVAAASSAQAGLTFRVDEGSVGAPTIPNVFLADRIDMTWNQRLNFNGGGNITAGGFLTFSLYSYNGDSFWFNQLSGLPGPASSPLYGLYGIYKWSGNLSGTTVTSTGGSIELWLDRDQNTGRTPPAPGSQTSTFTNTGDDVKLGESLVLLGGTVDPLPAPASWSLTYDQFALTAAGSTYFVGPTPFLDRLQLSSAVSSAFCTDTQPTPCSNTASSAGDLQFIPEPGMLTLLGISLVGLGLARRRSKVVA